MLCSECNDDADDEDEDEDAVRRRCSRSLVVQSVSDSRSERDTMDESSDTPEPAKDAGRPFFAMIFLLYVAGNTPGLLVPK